jgi:hypothetical protein
MSVGLNTRTLMTRPYKTHRTNRTRRLGNLKTLCIRP